MKKLKILGIITEDSAVGYYRMWQPLKTLERLGLAELKLTPTFTWGIDRSEVFSFPPLKWFSTDADNKDIFIPDIIVAERHDHNNYIALIGGLARAYKVPLVVDTDDDVQAVRPFNPGYGSYNPDADNVANNIKLMSIPDLSAITVSTEHLKERHLQYNKPIYVIPNSIDIKSRTFPPKKRAKKIRIGWMGSACHWENLQIIQQAVKDIVANYPQVEFIYTNLYGDVWGNPPKEVRNRVISVCKIYGCKEYHSACNKAYKTFDKYAKATNRLALDIGLAPLQDNLFNRSKSNLRLLEYWADKIAVIASPVRPYTETIINRKNGLLAKEKLDWYKSIEDLILNEELRNKLKEEGWKTLNDNFGAETNAKKLYKIYREIINNYARRNNTI